MWTNIRRKSSLLYSVRLFPKTQCKLATVLWNLTISCNYENMGTCITEVISHFSNRIRTDTIIVTYIRTVTMSCTILRKLLQMRNTVPLIKWLSSKQKNLSFSPARMSLIYHNYRSLYFFVHLMQTRADISTYRSLCPRM